jgi:hypothetical protein
VVSPDNTTTARTFVLKGLHKGIFPGNKRGSGTDVAIIKVAMLYEQTSEAHHSERGYAEEEAHKLAIECESVIDAKDREAIENAIA